MRQGKYFFLRHVGSGLVLDVLADKRDPGAKVGLWQQRSEIEDSQLWYYHHYTGTIRVRSCDFCLDVKDDQLVVNPFDVHHTKRWGIMGQRIHVEGNNNEVVESDDAAANEGSLLKVGNWVGSGQQLWKIEYSEPAYFIIRSKLSDRVLDIDEGNPRPNAKVVVYSLQKHPLHAKQMWYEDVNFCIRSKLNDYLLDINSSGQMVMSPLDPDNPKQRWVVEGDFLVNHSYNNHVVDVTASDKKNGAETCAFERHGGDNQRWEIEYLAAL